MPLNDLAIDASTIRQLLTLRFSQGDPGEPLTLSLHESHMLMAYFQLHLAAPPQAHGWQADVRLRAAVGALVTRVEQTSDVTEWFGPLGVLMTAFKESSPPGLLTPQHGDQSRVDSVPEGAHGDLPRPTTE